MECLCSEIQNVDGNDTIGFAQRYLEVIMVDSYKWRTLYKCGGCGVFWEENYHEGRFGGDPYLKVVSISHVQEEWWERFMEPAEKVAFLRDLIAGLGGFDVEHVQYDEQHFGNVLIKLKTAKGLNVIFTMDKGDCWCEVGNYQDSFFLEDLLAVLEIDVSLETHGLFELIIRASEVISKNQLRIKESLKPKSFKFTQKAVSVIAENRVKGWWGR